MKLADDVKQANRVFLIGNGGSAANAIHIANDWVACGIDARPLPADIATLTAIANDFSYAEIYSKVIMAIGRAGDLLVALSGSGNSPNVVHGLGAAKDRAMKTVLVTGAYHATCDAEKHADRVLRLGADMQAAEEMQLWVGHEVMRCLKK